MHTRLVSGRCSLLLLQKCRSVIKPAATPMHVPATQDTEQPSILQQPDVLQTLRLKDGRQVSISVCGDPDGRTVLFLHPIQGNRYMPLTMHKAAAALHLKIIALDRPGIGTSSPQPNRTVQQYPADVAEICQQMGIQQFSIFASSAGTMYALALTVAPETKHMVVGKVTIVAPWIPSSSRAPGFGGWLSLLGSWTPVPLLHIAIGFSNSRIAQQAHRRKQFKHAVENRSSAHAWSQWLTGTASDMAKAGCSSLVNTARFVTHDYLGISSNSDTDKPTLETIPAAVLSVGPQSPGTPAHQASELQKTNTQHHQTAPAYSISCNSLQDSILRSSSISCSSASSSESFDSTTNTTSDMLRVSSHYGGCYSTAAYIRTHGSGTGIITPCNSSGDISTLQSSAANCQNESDSSGEDAGMELSSANCNGKAAHHQTAARSQPITELMTRSNDVERAAFAADPGNDAIYKAMINEWNPSLSGIIQEMQLCTERSSKLHFNYIQDVKVPIRVYMGTADQVLLYSHVQHWAEQASNVELISVEGGTHDGLMHTHKVAALQALAQDLQVESGD